MENAQESKRRNRSRSKKRWYRGFNNGRGGEAGRSASKSSSRTRTGSVPLIIGNYFADFCFIPHSMYCEPVTKYGCSQSFLGSLLFRPPVFLPPPPPPQLLIICCYIARYYVKKNCQCAYGRKNMSPLSWVGGGEQNRIDPIFIIWNVRRICAHIW